MFTQDISLEYKLNVKSRATWREFDCCRLPISVGGEKHEGNKFKATINWVAKNFETVEIQVCDTLQRYNIMLKENLSPETAYKTSKRLGDEWIERNMPTIQLLDGKVNWRLYRWDEWLHRKEFPTYKKEIDRLMKECPEFKKSVIDQVEIFWQRRKEEYSLDQEQHFKKLSSQFLLEECAVFALAFEETKAVDIYPGTFLLPFTRLKNSRVPNLPVGFHQSHFTVIDFNRVKSKTANTA